MLTKIQGRVLRLVLVMSVLSIAGIAIYRWVSAPSGSPASSSQSASLDVQEVTSPPAPIRHGLPEALPTTELAGWLIDGSGEAIEGVSVHRISAEGAVGDVLATTEKDGAFRFATSLKPGPKPGEELMLVGDAIFDSTFRLPEKGKGKGVRIMATRRVSLSAKVMHDGRPVVGAVVELSDGSGPSNRVLLSDAQGLVDFRDLVPGAYEVWAHQKGLASTVMRHADIGSESSPLELLLQGASTGMGRVVDGQGGGLQATVRLLPADGNYAAQLVQSDEDGRFPVDGLLPGRWQVEAQAEGFVSSSPYVLQVTLDPLDFQVPLQKGAVLRGRVVDSLGSAVPNARIVVLQEGKAIRPTLAASSGTLRWVHPLATRRAMPGHQSRRFGAGRDGVRPSECGRGHCGVDIGSQRGRVIHAAADAKVLRVVRQSKGKAGRYLVLGHRGGLKSFYMHLEEISGDLEPGQNVRAGDPIASIGRTGVIRSGPHLHFAISQERGDRTWYIDPEPILRHAVVLPQPRTLGARADLDATLAVLVDDENRGRAPIGGSQPSQPILRSDAEGRFLKPGLIAGRYRLVAYHDQMAPGTSKPFALAGGRENSEIVVSLKPGVDIFGQVLGPEGPIADALVVAEEGSALLARTVAKTHTDAEGRYRLRPLSGTLTLRVSAPGYGDNQREVRLTRKGNAQREQRERFVLSLRDRRLEGMIRDRDGFPVRGAKIQIVGGPSGRGRRAVSDEYGHFLIPELSAGKYQLSVVSAESPTTRATINTEAPSDIRLAKGSAIRIRLFDAHNREALAGVRVQAFGPKDDRSSVVTDKDGVAHFTKMHLGSWTLKVRHQGYVFAESRVTLGKQNVRHDAVVERSLELARGATLAGILRDQNGERVAAARVWVGKATTTSDQDGRFRLQDVATGSVRIRAELQDRSGEAELQLHPGDEIVTLDLRLN